MRHLEIQPHGHVVYCPAFLHRDEADDVLTALLAMDMAPEVIRMFGSDIVTRRRTVQFGIEYAYNATAKRAGPWTPLTADLRDRVEAVAGRIDGALVQVYPDGRTGIGWHQDKGHPEVIASLSLGAERAFAFGVGPARACRETFRMQLAHGSLLLIPSAVNEALKHRLPIAAGITSPRANMTFRRFPAAST